MSEYPSIDGYLNWQAWPLDSDVNMTTTSDEAFKSALKSNGKSGPYIMGKFYNAFRMTHGQCN